MQFDVAGYNYIQFKFKFNIVNAHFSSLDLTQSYPFSYFYPGLRDILKTMD